MSEAELSLKLTSLVTFLFSDKKVTHSNFQKSRRKRGFQNLNFIHISLWKLKTFAVDKFGKYFPPHPLCKTVGNPHTTLWTKNRCGCKRNPSYPHKLLLLRLLLPIILSVYIYS